MYVCTHLRAHCIFLRPFFLAHGQSGYSRWQRVLDSGRNAMAAPACAPADADGQEEEPAPAADGALHGASASEETPIGRDAGAGDSGQDNLAAAPAHATPLAAAPVDDAPNLPPTNGVDAGRAHAPSASLAHFASPAVEEEAPDPSSSRPAPTALPATAGRAAARAPAVAPAGEEATREGHGTPLPNLAIMAPVAAYGGAAPPLDGPARDHRPPSRAGATIGRTPADHADDERWPSRGTFAASSRPAMHLAHSQSYMPLTRVRPPPTFFPALARDAVRRAALALTLAAESPASRAPLPSQGARQRVHLSWASLETMSYEELLDMEAFPGDVVPAPPTPGPRAKCDRATGPSREGARRRAAAPRVPEPVARGLPQLVPALGYAERERRRRRA